jgi:hypothetical protein
MLEEFGKAYLSWRDDGQKISETLDHIGIPTWDGSGNTRILIDLNA